MVRACRARGRRTWIDRDAGARRCAVAPRDLRFAPPRTPPGPPPPARPLPPRRGSPPRGTRPSDGVREARRLGSETGRVATVYLYTHTLSSRGAGVVGAGLNHMLRVSESTKKTPSPRPPQGRSIRNVSRTRRLDSSAGQPRSQPYARARRRTRVVEQPNPESVASRGRGPYGQRAVDPVQSRSPARRAIFRRTASPAISAAATRLLRGPHRAGAIPAAGRPATPKQPVAPRGNRRDSPATPLLRSARDWQPRARPGRGTTPGNRLATPGPGVPPPCRPGRGRGCGPGSPPRRSR